MTNLTMFPTTLGVPLPQPATIDLTLPCIGLLVVLAGLGLMLACRVATSLAGMRTLRAGSQFPGFLSSVPRGVNHGTVRH